MTQLPEIAQLGAEVLRAQAQAIDDFATDKFHGLLATLQAIMFDHNGVGIAAPQIGESWQIIVVASRPTSRYPNAPTMAPIVMVNPQYEIVDAEIQKDWEGCLSIPAIRALVPRYRAVRVKYQDAEGRYCELLLENFPARVFQHEYDHLLGKVYLDRVESNADIISESEFFKRMAA